MKLNAISKGRVYRYRKQPKPYAYSLNNKNELPPKPKLPHNIQFLASVKDLFSKKHYRRDDDGYFYVPECFSLMDNYEESFDFLKKLFVVLYKGKVEKVILDYEKCSRIDVDASICMDVLLVEYDRYLKACWSKGHNVFPRKIAPINLRRQDIINLLYSIGAYRNVAGLTIPNPKGVEPLPVLINYKHSPDVWRISEVHATNIVEYIKKCLSRLGEELTIQAETEFYKVIGEVMSNAEEHATMPHRFAIGYFQEDDNENDDHYGILNFSIFNFGNTIYQTFKDPQCPNKKVVERMSKLSESYTKKGWLKKADFEEETLWTLYALQDGVTSKAKKRGNGSIQFIKNFFKLKGNSENDNVSKLVLHSGNTRILFDGSYKIVDNKNITFNISGDIAEQPDKKCVTFTPYFFPGTIISARILIKSKNLAEKQ